MFERCKSFNQPLNKWDVSNVTDMESMFDRCESFNQDLSNWEVPYSVSMLYKCPIEEKYKPKFK
jgi:surface protein